MQKDRRETGSLHCSVCVHAFSLCCGASIEIDTAGSRNSIRSKFCLFAQRNTYTSMLLLLIVLLFAHYSTAVGDDSRVAGESQILE